MLIVLAVVSISVAGFGRWVTRAGRAPAWSAWLAYGQVVVCAVTGAFAYTKLRTTFDTITYMNPADRQNALRTDIQSSMIALAIGAGIALIVAIVLGAFWQRSTPRSSASSSPPSPSP
jgi:hypothetical protein